MISEQLYAFLKAWLNWAENGAENDKPFIRSVGLCRSARNYAEDNFGNIVGGIVGELISIWREEHLDHCYPFGEDEYLASRLKNSQHKDPNRLAWVKSKIKEYEDLNK